jgi:RES domain-containing protein
VIFRSVSPRYARPADIVSGYGSYRTGGRWNAREFDFTPYL